MTPASRFATPLLLSLAGGIPLAAAGCDDVGLLTPVDADEVTITLEVSGGFAGVSYAIEVDGADGETVGVSCESSCPFQKGEVLVPLSSDQIAALARSLEDAGITAWDGRDFGTECCDLFQYDLVFVRGERSVHVTGGAGLLPDDLMTVIGRLHGLAYGVVPALISPDTRDTDWPRDPYELGPTSVEGLELTAELRYAGGCAPHRIDLVVWGDWIPTPFAPPHIHALLTHDDGDDSCEALLHDERSFDLGPLREAYERAHGPIGDERPTVVLRLWDPLSASPLGRLVEIRL